MTVWSLAWRTALRRRRLFLWNVAVPLLLLVPVAASAAAAPHRTAVFGVFFVFFGTFGSAIPTVRDARDGWLDTVFRTGCPPARWVTETVLAAAALDFLQLAPVAAVFLMSGRQVTAVDALGLAGALGLALLAANLLGLLLAAAVGSLAEAALACAAASLLLLHFAGFFRPAGPGWTGAVARVNPFTPLREALGAVQAGGHPDPGGWLVPAALLLGAAGIACVAAGRWTRRFGWPHAA